MIASTLSSAPSPSSSLPFCEALKEGRTFGEAWARYFEVESKAESWSAAGGDIGRKRACFWSLLGDWTLQLKMTAPEPRR